MARIDSYTVITPTTDDYLLGTDSPSGGGPTRNFTIQSIIDLVDEEASGNTNDYLDDITVEAGFAAPSDDADKATITFSIGSQGDQTLDLGGAAFKAADHYATATALTTHINDTTNPHSLDSIVGNQTLAPTKLKGITSNGTDGQLISVDGNGNFSYVDDTDANDNYYLSSIQKTGNTVEFVVTGNTNVTTDIFKEAAFLTKSDIRTDVKNNVTFTTNNFTDLKALSKLDKVTVNEIQNLAVTNEKIANGTISEEKLNVTNNPTSGYVLTAGTTDGTFTWAANSASNYYLNSITKSGNTLTFDVLGLSAGSDPTYTFGGAAFADIGTTANDVAAGNHNHSISSLTGAGGLATKSSVGTSEITNKAVTAGKLSPTTAGTNGQVLALNSSNELVWVNSSGTTIADVRLLPSTIGNTNSGTAGTGPQLLRVNTAGTLVEYVDLSVDKNEFATGNSPAAGKVLGLDTNNDLQWIETPTPTVAADSITADKIDFIDDSLSASTAGHILISDGTDFGNVAMSGDANINSSGALTIQPAAINGQTAISSIGGTDTFLIYDVSATSLKKTTYADISAKVYTGISGDIQIASGGNATVNVGYSQLKNEFTDTHTQTLTTNNPLLNFGADAIFDLTLPGSAANLTFNIANAKKGMTKVFIIRTNTSTAYTGTLTFDVTNDSAGALTGTPTFVRLSSDDIVKTANTVNYMQITCIAEGSDAGDRTFIYTVGTAQ